MNQQKEVPETGERVLPEAEKNLDEKPAKPLEHGPPVEPAEQTAEAPDPFGGGPVDRPAKEQARTCGICGGPDHRGCGCEAKAGRQGGSETPTLTEIPQKIGPVLADHYLKQLNKLSPDQVFTVFHTAGKMFSDDVSAIGDQLGDINTALNMIVSQLDVLIESDKSRRDLLRDIQNANQN